VSEADVVEVIRAASAEVGVRPPPVDAVVQQGRRRVRRRRATKVGGTVVLVGILFMAGSVFVRQNTQVAPVGPTRHQNALPVPWWGDGTLHLAHVELPVAQPTALVALGDGAAFGTEAGDVIIVDAEGHRTTVGHHAPGAPMAAGDAEHWLVWVDPGDHAPELVVYDLAERAEVGRLSLHYRGPRWGRLDEGSYPISVDDGRVYYATQDGDWSWSPGAAAPRRETPVDTDLVDQRAGVQVTHTWTARQGWSNQLQVSQPAQDVFASYRGDGARLSPDGTYVAVGTGRRTDLFQVGSRNPLDLDLSAPKRSILSIAFPDDHSVVLVSGGELTPAPTDTSGFIPARPAYSSWDITTCDLDTGACHTRHDLTTETAPLLPGG